MRKELELLHLCLGNCRAVANFLGYCRWHYMAIRQQILSGAASQKEFDKASRKIKSLLMASKSRMYIHKHLTTAGRITMSLLLFQYLKEMGLPVKGFDTDPINNTFAGYKEFEIQTLEIMDGDDIDPRRFDRLMEAICECDDDTRSRFGEKDWVLPYTREAGRTFELKTGTVISGVMVSGINSDLPGHLIAQVSQNVYDTATGQDLLIPQGSKLFGVYDSRVVYGQSRVLIAWNRALFPDGSSITLEIMPGYQFNVIVTKNVIFRGAYASR